MPRYNKPLNLRIAALPVLFSFACLLAARPATAQSNLAALPAVAPVMACEKLSTVDLSSAVGGKAHITAAESVAEGKPAPYCRVTGYVEPAIKFEVRLPLTTWTQRFVQTGCGGLCGSLGIRVGHDEGCYPSTHGELVLSSTDMGHSGEQDGEFGGRDYQLRVDFAYRGVHSTTLASKALIAAYYGQAPKYSYFSGCSDGGREALMEAERYPNDFNGILAGAPAMNFVAQNTFYHGWNAVKNTAADGTPILTAAQLPILHKAVLDACDAADGVKDGLVSEPLSCHPDPAVVECKAGADTSTCLTHAQVETARAFYEGAHTASGEKLVISGPLPGSELAWAGVYVPQAGSTRIFSTQIATGTLKYLAYEKNPPATYTLNDLQFTSDSFAAATKLHSLYDATDPDLSPYAKAGGKIILWHGYADPHISPLNTIAYYTSLSKAMGQKSVQQFARLYLFPGGYHCAGGEGPFDVDLMSAIMGWVEKGSAPFALKASHTVGAPRGPIAGVPAGMPAGGMPPNGARAPGTAPNGAPPNGAMRTGQGTPGGAPAAPAKVDRVRPVYPYPLTAKYNGTGNIDDASSFSAGPEKPATAAQMQWLGSSFYSAHYEQWCSGKGLSMTCTAKP